MLLVLFLPNSNPYHPKFKKSEDFTDFVPVPKRVFRRFKVPISYWLSSLVVYFITIIFASQRKNAISHMALSKY
jgi:hypothetical protein